jgi:precorrin-6B methylase 2
MMNRTQVVSLLLVVLLLSVSPATPLSAGAGSSTQERYTQESPSRDGTGRYYMGREIAQVMGFSGASWLERPSREKEEQPQLLLKVLALKEGDVVAGIGAGTGYHSRRMAQAVGSSGMVYAVDVQFKMLQLLIQNLQKEGIQHVRAVLGSETDPRLAAESLDLALMVDVYHEFSYPYEMLQAICQALKPGGRLVFVEYRAKDSTVPIKPLHKMSEEQVKREAAVHPLKWVETSSNLPWQDVIIFEKQ